MPKALVEMTNKDGSKRRVKIEYDEYLAFGEYYTFIRNGRPDQYVFKSQVRDINVEDAGLSTF